MHLYSAEEVELAGIGSKLKKAVKRSLNPKNVLNPKKLIKGVKEDLKTASSILAKAAPLTPVLSVIPGVGTAVAAGITLAAKAAQAREGKLAIKAGSAQAKAAATNPEVAAGMQWLEINAPQLLDAVLRIPKQGNSIESLKRFGRNPAAALDDPQIIVQLKKTLSAADLQTLLDAAKARLAGGVVQAPAMQQTIKTVHSPTPVFSPAQMPVTEQNAVPVTTVSSPQMTYQASGGGGGSQVPATYYTPNGETAVVAEGGSFFDQYKWPILIGGGGVLLVIALRAMGGKRK